MMRSLSGLRGESAAQTDCCTTVATGEALAEETEEVGGSGGVGSGPPVAKCRASLSPEHAGLSSARPWTGA